MEKREILKETELFVLDMDGTFYLDTDVLDGALDFLEEVKKAGKRYVFFTNNSSKSPKTYIDKLAKMGCYIKRNQIITSGDVMIQYLKEYYPEKKVYLVGTPDLEENFRENGILLSFYTQNHFKPFDTRITASQNNEPHTLHQLLKFI